MKEKIFATIVIILAIVAIVYKLKTAENTSENLSQDNLQNGKNITIEENDNFTVEDDKNLNLIGNTTLNSSIENTIDENIVTGSYVENNKGSSIIVQLTSKNFEEEVLKSDKTVIVDFYADWCGPCQVLSPILEEIAEENSEIKVCKLNVDYEEELSAEYGVQYLPTVIIFKNGEIYDKLIGLQEKSFILEKCK